MTDILSMFILGLLATGHCIGMCAPLVIIFPGRTGRFFPQVYYHFGRILTYTAVGAFMGGIGNSLPQMAATMSMDPVIWALRGKIVLAVVAGLFFLFLGIIRMDLVADPSWMGVTAPNKIPGYRHIVDNALKKDKPAAMVWMGILMGFLPCGVSYGAFAGALSAQSIRMGLMVTFAFGLGTLPGLLLFGTGAGMIMQRFRHLSDRLSGLMMMGIGLKLLFHGIKMMM